MLIYRVSCKFTGWGVLVNGLDVSKRNGVLVNGMGDFLDGVLVNGMGCYFLGWGVSKRDGVLLSGMGYY